MCLAYIRCWNAGVSAALDHDSAKTTINNMLDSFVTNLLPVECNNWCYKHGFLEIRNTWNAGTNGAYKQHCFDNFRTLKAWGIDAFLATDSATGCKLHEGLSLCAFLFPREIGPTYSQNRPNKLKQWIPSPPCDETAFDPREVEGQVMLGKLDS